MSIQSIYDPAEVGSDENRQQELLQLLCNSARRLMQVLGIDSGDIRAKGCRSVKI